MLVFARLLMVLLLLLLGVSIVKSEYLSTTQDVITAESATFTNYDTATYTLLQPPNSTDPFVRTIEFEYRTSHVRYRNMFSMYNERGDYIFFGISGFTRLIVTIIGPDIYKGIEIRARTAANGEWHRLSVQIESGGQLVLDDEPLDERLPSNFNAQFPYDNKTVVTFGRYYRGCFANASLDTVVLVPLHSSSELLNQPDPYLHPLAIDRLPKTGPGCRQSPCVCEPNGACIYKQWDLLDRCNCTRGYDPNSKCKYEWNTCTATSAWLECQNGGRCVNMPGIYNFKCVCKDGYFGSRCQNVHICLSDNPCQNGGTCTVYGDYSYRCSCATDFTGQKCEVSLKSSDSGRTSLIIGLSVSAGVVLLIGLIGVGVFVVKKKGNQSKVS